MTMLLHQKGNKESSFLLKPEMELTQLGSEVLEKPHDREEVNNIRPENITESNNNISSSNDKCNVPGSSVVY